MPATKSPVKETKLRLGDLFEDIPYMFRVRAENNEGVGEASPATEQVYCRDRIGIVIFYDSFGEKRLLIF